MYDLHELLRTEQWFDGDATLHVLFMDGTRTAIRNLNLAIIESECPLLAFAFEASTSGPVHYIDNVSPETVTALLSFAHAKNYRTRGVKTRFSLLSQVQIYHLAQRYDIDAMRSDAQHAFGRLCAASTHVSTPPGHLCEAITFIYDCSPGLNGLKETILAYCIANFLHHELDKMDDFQRLVYRCTAFRQDLCRLNSEREFEDEAAMPIVQLCARQEGPSPARAERALGDSPLKLPTKPAAAECLRERSDANTCSAVHRAIDLPFRYQRRRNHKLPPSIPVDKEDFFVVAYEKGLEDAYDSVATPASPSLESGFEFVTRPATTETKAYGQVSASIEDDADGFAMVDSSSLTV